MALTSRMNRTMVQKWPANVTHVLSSNEASTTSRDCSGLVTNLGHHMGMLKCQLDISFIKTLWRTWISYTETGLHKRDHEVLLQTEDVHISIFNDNVNIKATNDSRFQRLHNSVGHPNIVDHWHVNHDQKLSLSSHQPMQLYVSLSMKIVLLTPLCGRELDNLGLE